MTGLFNPENGWEVALLAFISLCGVLTVVLPVWLNQRKHGKDLGDIKHQVKNDHKTNLREDLDEIRDLVLEGFARNDRSLEGLRDELRLERQERINGDRIRIEANSLNIKSQ